jgi:hypothetical protein
MVRRSFGRRISLLAPGHIVAARVHAGSCSRSARYPDVSLSLPPRTASPYPPDGGRDHTIWGKPEGVSADDDFRLALLQADDPTRLEHQTPLIERSLLVTGWLIVARSPLES